MARPRRNPTTPILNNRACFIYARVSTKEQEQEGYSIDAQLMLLRRYVESKGLIVVQEFVEAESASKTGRPAFAKMLKGLRDGYAGCIVVEKTDRLTRSIRDYSTIQELIDSGVEVHTVKEGEVYSKASRSHSKFIFGIKVCVAELYSNNLSEEVKKGMTQKASEGYWPSQAPFGYLNITENGRRIIIPDPDRWVLVAKLFNEYANGGHSMRDCARVANDIGLRGKRGARLNPSSVQWILTNPVYMGRVKWDGVDVPGKHDPIVSLAVWNKVQEVMKGRSVTKTTESNEYAFKGLMRCGVCGCAVTPYRVKGKYVYYSCTGYKGCKRTPVREEAIVEQVAQVLDGVSLRPETAALMVATLREVWESMKQTEGPKRDQFESMARRTEDKLARLYLDYMEGKVPASAYDKLKSQWELELETQRAGASRLANSTLKTLDDSAKMIHGLSNCSQVFRTGSNAVRRQMAKAILSNCEIADGIVSGALRDWFKSVYEVNLQVTPGMPEEAEKKLWWA